MDDEGKYTLIHAIAGFATGFYHTAIGQKMLPLVVATLFVLRGVSLSTTKNEGSWWFGNGMWPYLTTLFAVWTVMSNI